MTFFLTAWRDKRKTKTNKRRASSSSSSSSTSPQDSGFGGSSFSTVSDQSSNVGAFTTLSSLSSLSPRQQQQHQKLLLQKNGHGGQSRFRSTWSADKSGGDSRNGSSISTMESRQHHHHHHFVYPSSAGSPSSSSHPLAPLSPFSAHYERSITPPLMSRPSPSSSSARFKAALSRLLLLPRKGDQHYYPPCTTAAAASANYKTTRTCSSRPNAISSLEVAKGCHLDDGRLTNNTNNNGHHPLLQPQHKKKQQLFHRKHPLLTIKTSTTAPPSVLSPLSPLSPFSSSNGGASNVVGVLPIPADPTAPACFPGTGPVDFALKSQQLQQFQPTSSSRRPSLTPSLTPSLSRVTSPTSPTTVSGRHLIPHHHHRNHMHMSTDSMSNNPASLSSTLMLRRGSVESIAMSLHSLNNGPSSTHLLRRGSVESMTMSLYDYERTNASSSNNWTMPTSNNDRRMSISGRSMDEMEVVVVSSSRNGESLDSSVHPFAHQPHNTGRYENSGECDYDDDETESGEAPAALSDRFGPRSVQQQHKKTPSLSPSMMAHFSQIEKVTSSASASKTKSSLGQGYDISTMFQVGPLTTPSSPMA
ncbi:hypothetical protein BGZ88_007438 [Linnemannia elongata]|nr:hypothetical protein BGZ88_007438 [Linnemannia elongata]